MKVVVTGGAGFIGSNLVRELMESGHGVIVVDDLSTGRESNLVGTDVQLLEGDVRDRDVMRRVVGGAEIVFHLAALPSVARSMADPLRSHSVNVDGTLSVLVAARDADVRRVVYASSSSIYGDTPALPKHEAMAPSPRSPYAATKLAGEAYCRAFAAAFGLETVSLRFFNVFGEAQDPSSQYAAVIPRFLTQMLAGERPEIFGDGTQSRDFTHVRNAVSACMLAASADGVAGEVMNIACGGRITLIDLVSLLNDILGTDVQPTFGSPRPGDIQHSLASIDKAARLLGYRPVMDVPSGLRATAEWFARVPASRP